MTRSSLRDSYRAEELAALEHAMPEYLIFVNAETSHLISSLFDRVFLSRLFGLFSGYELVAVSPFGSSTVLEDAALAGNLQIMNATGSMLVFRRPGASAPATGINFGRLFRL